MSKIQITNDGWREAGEEWMEKGFRAWLRRLLGVHGYDGTQHVASFCARAEAWTVNSLEVKQHVKDLEAEVDRLRTIVHHLQQLHDCPWIPDGQPRSDWEDVPF